MDYRTSVPASRSWLDVSVPVAEHLTVFPGTPGAAVHQVHSLDQGDQANVSELRMSTHTGTHVDAPVHFVAGAAGIDKLDLDALNGPARVISVPDVQRIGPEALSRHEPGRGERILLRTRNSDTAWYQREFDPDYAHLTAQAARLLVQRGIAAVGIDYLSIGGEEFDTVETHRVLLGAGVAVLEGLDLCDVEPGRYELRCLPLRVAGGDGAPARALLLPAGDG
ncbi:MAG TPA: cyclase family protein [Jiangellaceae bacterium]|nr:cyclase family protein [Jiangellaceae bacterium]